MEQGTKVAILAGATGLVGKQLLRQLLESPHYREVVALVRRPLLFQHAKLRQVVFDFDHPDATALKGDDLYCALGTTLRKAGSKEAQYTIDGHYPAELGRLAKEQGVRQYLLVSSMGANAQSSAFYLRVKGELEQKLAGMGFDSFIAARPFFLTGDRSEFRLGEKISIGIVHLLQPVLPKKYKGIADTKVARALISLANDNLKGVHYIESDKLQDY